MQKIITILIIALAIVLVPLQFSSVADTVTNLDNGAKIFKANCAGCHVKGGNIVRRGKNLKSKALHRNKVDTYDAVTSLVTNGKGLMSAYGDKLTPEEISEVATYVLHKAEQNWK